MLYLSPYLSPRRWILDERRRIEYLVGFVIGNFSRQPVLVTRRVLGSAAKLLSYHDSETWRNSGSRSHLEVMMDQKEDENLYPREVRSPDTGVWSIRRIIPV